MGILRKRVMNDNAVSKAHRPLANFKVFMPFDSRERKSQLTASFFQLSVLQKERIIWSMHSKELRLASVTGFWHFTQLSTLTTDGKMC